MFLYTTRLSLMKLYFMIAGAGLAYLAHSWKGNWVFTIAAAVSVYIMYRVYLWDRITWRGKFIERKFPEYITKCPDFMEARVSGGRTICQDMYDEKDCVSDPNSSSCYRPRYSHAKQDYSKMKRWQRRRQLRHSSQAGSGYTWHTLQQSI